MTTKQQRVVCRALQKLKIAQRLVKEAEAEIRVALANARVKA